MDNGKIIEHLNVSKEMLLKKLDDIYEIPVNRWDDTETDMMRDIWETLHHMCEVKQKMM